MKIRDDTLFEGPGPEEFSLSLTLASNSSDLLQHAVIVSPDVFVIRILDDDGEGMF